MKTLSHLDMFGQDVSSGEFIVASSGTTLRLLKVIKVTPKMLVVETTDNKRKQHKMHKYPKDVCKIEAEVLTFYLIKK